MKGGGWTVKGGEVERWTVEGEGVERCERCQVSSYRRKHTECGGVGTTRIFFEKHKELAGSVMRVVEIYSRHERQAQCAFCAGFTTVSPRSVAD